ncbi:unnamed protein product [Cylindrotheca closterium]|uniref:Uncharacterized protein n=1 Tax=Cylindrotheca closterium TaxID=2856 RepID=A0AAD2CTD8_9STRA|nr:unnamed protein product [Cylindrotheca closterium]
MSPTTFVCETPMIRERPQASLTPPSPPSKRHCSRISYDLPSSPCESLFLPLLSHFDKVAEDDGEINGPFFPTLAPRPTSCFNSFHKLSIKEPENEQPFALKKRSSSMAFNPTSLEPCSNKQKLSVHALCA